MDDLRSEVELQIDKASMAEEDYKIMKEKYELETVALENKVHSLKPPNNSQAWAWDGHFGLCREVGPSQRFWKGAGVRLAVVESLGAFRSPLFGGFNVITH